MRILFMFIGLFITGGLLQCQAPDSKLLKTKSLVLVLDNLPVDSCSVRVHHIITGEEVYHNSTYKIGDTLYIPSIDDDMYIAVFSWPKTLISHRIFHSKQFNKEEDADYFELTKPIFLQDRTDSLYKISVVNDVTQEEIESSGAEVIAFKNLNCKACDLADEYWALYSSFFSRKKDHIDSVRQVYYNNVKATNLEKARESYLLVNDLERNYQKDDILDAALIKKIKSNEDSQVSMFFLFYQLYNHRDFDKFRGVFNGMSGDARKSKYYNMVYKQYHPAGV
ncbi:hypothetical protein [Sphingobacterium psychroaquaticum]|uniref:DUF4369 domain-containing protein n=1 Tax=Sphingobacterium psychroaquaticum TaxID=561061 RepID=A0A1X7J1T7_9SPHI|nr:hypothetical protein [Sphingobacterium psychroaquaticum]SMG21138.1 hypothetical protein SAMN05660862_1323 [Sphingobacterium psychroaquaticum]